MVKMIHMVQMFASSVSLLSV